MLEDIRPLKALLRDPPQSDIDRGWRAVEARVHPIGPRRRTGLVILAPLLVALLIAVLRFGRSPVTSSNRLLSLASGASLSVLDSGAQTSNVELSDGSRIQLAPHTRLATRAIDARRFDSELLRGKATFDVVPHGPRRWTIVASNVRVSVLGTRFSVERLAAGVRVSVERGLVEVVGPDVPEGHQQLTAAQNLCVACAGSTPSAAAPPSATPAIETTPVHDQAPTRATVGAAHRPNASGGDNVEQLLARADAARRSGQSSQAAGALNRLIAQFPEDPRTALAAFTLGQLYLEQLHEPRRAAQAFERAEALALPQALAEEGAARIVQAYDAAHDVERARNAASRYREQYPNGARRRAVDGWASRP